MKYNIYIITLLLFIAPGAHADMITFEHRNESTVFGVIGDIQFNARFVITAIGDTDDRKRNGNVWSNEHLSASIEIEGVGTFDFITLTRTFVNNGRQSVGFSRARSAGGLDLFTGPSDPVFAAWDMSTSIGPINNNDGRLTQWTNDPVETTGGILAFDIEEGLRVTFTATVIPAPAALALFGIAGFTTKRRRRNR